MEEKNIALLGFVSSAADYLKEQIKDDSEEIKPLEEVDLNKIKSELENKLGSSFDGAKNKSDDLINAGREVFDNFISKSPTLIDEFKDIFDVDFKKENDEKDEKIVSHLINILKKPQENDETDELVNQIAKAASKATVETKPKVETDNTEEDKELDSIFSEILANENIEEEKSDSNPIEEETNIEENSKDEPKLDPNEIKQLIKDTISEFFIDKKQEAEVKLDEVIDSFEELKNAVENPVNEEQIVNEEQTDLNQEDEQIDLNSIDEDVELEEVKYEELNPNNDSLLGGVFKRVDQPQEIEEPVLEENAIIEDVFVDDGSLEGENDESLDLELEDDDLKLATSQLEDEVNNEQTSDSFITVDDILNSFNAPKVDDDAEINSVLKEAENNYLVNYESSYEESAPKKKNKDNDSEEIVLNDFNIEEAIEKEFLEIQNRKVETEEPKKTNDDDYSFVDGVLVSEAELEEESFKPVEEETISNTNSTKEDLSSNKEAELEEELNEETPIIEETLGSTVEEDSNAIEEIVDSNLADEALNLAEEEMNTAEETKASSDELQEKREEESGLEVDLNSINEEADTIEESSEEIETSDDEIVQEQEDIDEDLIEEAIEDQEDALKLIAKEESNLAFEEAFGVEENSEDSDIEEPVDSNLEKEKLEDLADLETLDLIFEELSKEHEEEYNLDYKELDADEESTNPSDELKDDTNLIEETSSEEADTNEESDSLESEIQEASEEMQAFDDEINQEQEEVETVEETEASSDELQEKREEESNLEELDTEKQDDSGLDNESLDSNEAEYSSSNLDEEFTLDGCDIEESLEEMANEDSDDISLFDDVPLSQKLSSFTDQYEASDNPYSRDVGYPIDKDDYAFEVAREHGDDSISSFLKELKENKEQDFSQQANDIVADLIDQCKTLCPDVKEEETELVEEENEPIMIDNDYIEAYKNRTLEEIYIPNPGLDALEEETVEDSSTIEEESNLEDTEETREEVEDNSNEDAYLNDLFADFTNNDYEVDEVSDKQKQEEAKRKEIYDSIVTLYPYLSNGFIKGVYDLKQSFANDYKDGEKMVILHRLRFENINGLRQFVDVMINHGYLVNVDEKQMIVDTFKEHVNSDGKILTDIFEIANQAKLLTGDYEGYRIIEDEL